ncbi:hypothetical protein CP532_0805 [Ophiocordyceps camponoti-leonardi (nom. inval.)]|nr:hypothetical protein CP532_0805 [Ophiocordyceps camponoti-leonardi (nom. inval.)]
MNVGRHIDWGSHLLKHLPWQLFHGNTSHDIPFDLDIFRKSINEISKGGKQKEDLEQLAEWILEHHSQDKRICWPKHEMWEILTSYKNMLDGLHNLFVSEQSLRYDISATFAREEPKPIDRNKPYCINASSPYYTDITRVIATAAEKDLGSYKMQNYLNVFQHPFLHALAAASRDEYECSFTDGCTSHLSYSQPMLPDSFDHFWAAIVQAFAFKLPLCLIFSAVPDLDPDYVYVMGGTTA